MKSVQFLFLLCSIFYSAQAEEKVFHYYCTVADANHYSLLLNLIGSIHKNDFDQLDEIALFDIGLSDDQKSALNKIDKLKIYEIEKVNPEMATYFKTDPAGRMVRGWYTWKPAVFKQALEYFPYFIYLDSGTTVLKNPDDLFRHIKENGYFLIHLSPIQIEDRMTRPVKEQVVAKLLKSQAETVLKRSTPMIDAGFQGISKEIFNQYVFPVYLLAQNPALFADDGTATLGFGAGRHDQTLFSIFAHANNLQLNGQGWSQLSVDGKTIPFHLHHDPNVLNDLTTIYRSRADIYYGGEKSSFIRLKINDSVK